MRVIPVEDVHRLCSGQVITTLTDAVKELLDNAIDSGGKNISVMLTDAGRASIDVTDDGSGIQSVDYDNLCLKYTTSKLQTMEDLKQMTSLGFRGEALSSLCNVSALVRVVTKTSDERCGHILEFDQSGAVVKREFHVSNTGTTVTVKGLFAKIPVRQKCLMKEKPQTLVHKVIHLMRDYAIAMPHMHFVLWEWDVRATPCPQKKTLLNFTVSRSLRDRISSVLFPAPEFLSLIPVTEIPADIAAEFSVSPMALQALQNIGMEGAISNTGTGRSNGDMQFFSVNGRPVDFPKLAKIINQTFRAYDPTASGRRYPFFVINLTIPLQMVDVNVTPDKRTVMIQHENAVCALVKSTIVQTFGQVPVSLKQTKYSESASQALIVPETTHTVSAHTQRMRDLSFTGPEVPDPSNKRITDFFEPTTRPSATTTTGPVTGSAVSPFPEPDLIIRRPLDLRNQADGFPSFQSARTVPASMHHSESETRSRRSRSGSFEGPGGASAHRPEVSGVSNPRNKRMRCSTPTENSPPTFRVPDVSQIQTRARSEGDSIDAPVSGTSISVKIPERRSISINVDLEAIRDDSNYDTDTVLSQSISRFRLDVDSAASEKEAIGEMERLLHKNHFREMEVVGQFNRGFIVTQMGKDLLIVDQHAADERCNFDELLANTVMESQPLIRPEFLFMTLFQESILQSNLNHFEKNGFRFSYNESTEAGSRFKLTAVPSSGDKLLSSDDMYELLEDVQPFGSSPVPAFIRPTKVKEILAMRACKKSIKINDSLTRDQMRKLIDRLAETSSPWTCAHGRPTVRFLSRVGQKGKDTCVPELSSQPDDESSDE